MKKSRMEKYKVVYATGSRADYGIVRNYLKYLQRDERIDLSLLVTGTHLSEKYGYSVADIRSDNITIAKEIPLALNTLGREDVTNALARVIEESGRYFAEEKVDLLVVLGDRYEILGVSIAAALNGVPILHLHGGEITLGNYDEFIRHSITKMSTYHFTSTEEYRKRVIQLGEAPERVFNMGALGAENCTKYDRENVLESVKALHGKKYFVVLFHPETASGAIPAKQVEELLAALGEVPNGYQIVLIGTNADTNADSIHEKIIAFKDKTGCTYFQNLNPDSYLDLVANAQAIIGNSSSGIIEAPTLQTYTVNIGRRQEGRIRASSVLDVDCNRLAIVEAIKKVCQKIESGEIILNPYFKADTARNCFEKTVEILQGLQKQPKIFYDCI